jgi:hypothetical protein
MKIDRPRGTERPDATPEASQPGRAETPGAPFSEVLRGESGPAVAGAGLEGIAGLVAQLRAGEMTMDGLLEKLVDRVAETTPLGPQGRLELRSTLRAILEDDPTLRRLTRAIEQG